MLINFVSNIPKDLRSGGFSAMNFAAFSALSSTHKVKYTGPVDPPPSLRQKVISKALRLAGRPGAFFAFSEARLRSIAVRVVRECSPAADLDFFHGFTQWVATRPTRPYVTWSDCTFRDYIDHFHRREDFQRADIVRIEKTEAAWLLRAECVAFTSHWAAARAREAYGLDGDRVVVVGISGELEPPERDDYNGDDQFAFVSTNFEAKGGPVVIQAFQEIRQRHPTASLVVVGDRGNLQTSEAGITFTGFLRKEDPTECGRLRKILATSRALVNATTSDMTPVVLVEAGYFGCPVVSSRRFAIPELIEDGRTGILVDDPTNPHAVAKAMTWMLEARSEYHAMRRAAWEKSRRDHGKARFRERLLGCLDFVRGKAAVPLA